ncbi:MAG TPA: phasin family protein, partial [Rubrivivax sp.]|nr:phasin family protein [Rubrivivax sp.]
MAVKKKGKLGSAAASSGSRQDQNLLYSASQIWSAGLGAMSRAQSGGTKFFDELVREGTKLQGGAIDTAQKVVRQAFEGAQKSVNQRVGDVRGQATETWDNLEKIFQTRVQRALHQLGMPTAEEIGSLARKVNELTHSVDKLAQAQQAPARKAPARKSARKAAGKSAKKSAKKSARAARGKRTTAAGNPPRGT